jgi:hypothetical protein
MKPGRNSEGKFTKGHTGFKPKGAVSKKKQKLEQRLNLLFSQLEINMEESIKALSPRQTIKLWMDLTKLTVPKLKRIPWVPDPVEKEEEATNKVLFEFVNPDGSKYDNPDLNTTSK